MDETVLKRLAIPALVGAGCLWGMSFLFGKLAFHELSVSQVVLYCFALASLVLLPVALWQRIWPRPRDLPLFVLTGFLTVTMTFLVQFLGLKLTSASNAALVIGLLPPLLALAAVILTHERLSKGGWLSIGCSSLGPSSLSVRPVGTTIGSATDSSSYPYSPLLAGRCWGNVSPRPTRRLWPRPTASCLGR